MLFTELRRKATVQHIADLMTGADIRYDPVPRAGNPAHNSAVQLPADGVAELLHPDSLAERQVEYNPVRETDRRLASRNLDPPTYAPHSRRGAPGVPSAGHWAPDLLLHTENGPVRLAELTRDARPLLLDLTEDGALAGSLDSRVKVVTARADGPTTAMLLRPDCYVAWSSTAPHPDRAELSAAVARWFGAEQASPVTA